MHRWPKHNPKLTRLPGAPRPAQVVEVIFLAPPDCDRVALRIDSAASSNRGLGCLRGGFHLEVDNDVGHSDPAGSARDAHGGGVVPDPEGRSLEHLLPRSGEPVFVVGECDNLRAADLKPPRKILGASDRLQALRSPWLSRPGDVRGTANVKV